MKKLKRNVGQHKRQSGTRLFAIGAAIGATMLSIALASVPRQSRITDDTAIYQQLSEIRVPRESSPNFDPDIARLSRLEPRYRESLPPAKDPRIAGPMHRISKQKYRYQGTSR